MRPARACCWRFKLLARLLLVGQLLASCFLPIARAMICYRCTVLPAQFAGEKDQPCSKFDAGPNFYQDCPTSTFCVKRIIHYRLSNGSMVTTYERDCAPQKYVFQDYSNDDRRWHSREKIDTEAYTDGCFQGENRGTPNGPSEYCYCSSNYCNQSSSPLLSRDTCFVLLLIVTSSLALLLSPSCFIL